MHWLDTTMISFVVGSVMVIACKILYEILSLKVSKMEQYLHTRAIVTIRYWLINLHRNMYYCFEFSRFAFIFVAYLALPREYNYMAVTVFWTSRLLPILYSQIILSDIDGGYEIFKVELIPYFIGLIYQTGLIVIIYCIVILFGIGVENQLDQTLSTILVTFTLAAAIWLIGGGLGRLMRKISQKLFKRRTRFRNAFQN